MNTKLLVLCTILTSITLSGSFICGNMPSTPLVSPQTAKEVISTIAASADQAASAVGAAVSTTAESIGYFQGFLRKLSYKTEPEKMYLFLKRYPLCAVGIGAGLIYGYVAYGKWCDREAVRRENLRFIIDKDYNLAKGLEVVPRGSRPENIKRGEEPKYHNAAEVINEARKCCILPYMTDQLLVSYVEEFYQALTVIQPAPPAPALPVPATKPVTKSLDELYRSIHLRLHGSAS